MRNIEKDGSSLSVDISFNPGNSIFEGRYPCRYYLEIVGNEGYIHTRDNYAEGNWTESGLAKNVLRKMKIRGATFGPSHFIDHSLVTVPVGNHSTILISLEKEGFGFHIPSSL